MKRVTLVNRTQDAVICTWGRHCLTSAIIPPETSTTFTEESIAHVNLAALGPLDDEKFALSSYSHEAGNVGDVRGAKVYVGRRARLEQVRLGKGSRWKIVHERVRQSTITYIPYINLLPA